MQQPNVCDGTQKLTAAQLTAAVGSLLSSRVNARCRLQLQPVPPNTQAPTALCGEPVKRSLFLPRGQVQLL
jgi:hypothetical protein